MKEILIVSNLINFHLFVKTIIISENSSKLKKAVLSPVIKINISISIKSIKGKIIKILFFE